MANQLNNVHNFDPASIPPLTNKVIIVTGGNAGIGLQTVLALAKHSPAKIYLGCRSRAKFEKALEEVLKTSPNAAPIVHVLELDLNSLAAVKKAAEYVIQDTDRLHILFNNAGILGVPPTLTADGYEAHFGVNYLGHALLNKHLMPLLQKTAQRPELNKGDVRIINVSSAAGWLTVPKSKDGIDLELEKTSREGTNEYWRYGVSKLAQIAEARMLAKQYPEVYAIAIHPGRVQTTIVDSFLARAKWTWMGIVQRVFDALGAPLTPEQGAYTQLWAATANVDLLENGGLYTPVGVREKGSKWCQDDAFAKRLYDWTHDQFNAKGVA